MTLFLLWALFHVGLVYLVTESAIAAPARVLLTRGLTGTLGDLLRAFLYCSGCVGFWIGGLGYVLGWDLVADVFAEPWQRAFAQAVIGMGLGALWSLSSKSSRVYEFEQGWGKETDDDDGAETEEEQPGEDARGGGGAGAERDGGDAPLPPAPPSDARTRDDRPDGRVRNAAGDRPSDADPGDDRRG